MGTAILGWLLAGGVAAVAFARPFRSAGAAVGVIATVVFLGTQVYRMQSLDGAAARYLPVAFVGGLGFVVAGLLSDTIVTRLRGIMMQIENNAATLQEAGVRDSLTGTLKASYANRLLSEEMDRTQRYNHSLALVLLSAGEWPTIDGQRGAKEAEQKLKAIGEALMENVRLVDTVARQGESQFLVILPETELMGAHAAAGRLCRTVATKTSLQLRAGVAVFPSDVAGKNELMTEVQAALAFAHRTGITVASPFLMA